MRGVLLAGVCLVAVGCGSKGKPTGPVLPPASVGRDQRLDAFDLWHAYGRKAIPDKHPLDGKLVLLKLTDAYATTDGDGRSVLLYGSQQGKLKPVIVVRLSDTTGYTAGESQALAYVEGTLRGAVPISEESWAKPWLTLPQEGPLQKMHAIVVDDAKLVLPPTN
jgi:hypothetical protein